MSNVLSKFPRFQLAVLPTPIEELKKLSKVLCGPRLLVKRDDLTGLAFGGNKLRKLEFILGEALKQDIDTLITIGSIESNHCRLTAAAAIKAGLRCELILKGQKPAVPNGNVLLDNLFKAQIHWFDDYVTEQEIGDVLNQSKAAGHKPFLIPIGGSTEVGALGYVNAMVELNQQLKERKEKVDYIVFATCSGGTQTGISVGAKLVKFEGDTQGICIDTVPLTNMPEPDELANLSNQVAKNIELDYHFSSSDFIVHKDYLGQGYAVMGDLEREAIHLAAEHEGLILDPVYTSRAFGGLIDLIRKGVFKQNETVLFWHTGGTPALFSYADRILT